MEILTKNSDFRRENKIIKYLYRNQEKYFDEYQLDFKFLKNYQDKKKKLSLPDIQNCLCEYYKYYKIKNDKGRARRKFKLEEARKNTELKQIFEKAPEIKPEVVYRKFNF